MTDEIINEINTFFKEDGLYDTYSDKIKLFKTTKTTPKAPLIYDYCLVLVLKGKKLGYLANNTFEYNPSRYLVIPTTLPFECQTIASKEEPFICMLISIDKKIMYEVIDLISQNNTFFTNKNTLGVFSDKVTLDIKDIIKRIIKALKSQEESTLLINLYLKELFYKVAKGENASILYKMFLNSKNEAKIARSLRLIHNEYNKYLDIPTLAKKENMSVSSFHTHFKKITGHTPLQYIKKIRLNKSHELIKKYNYLVLNAAYEIGYDNVSHFSKDFKSYFGYSAKSLKDANMK